MRADPPVGLRAYTLPLLPRTKRDPAGALTPVSGHQEPGRLPSDRPGRARRAASVAAFASTATGRVGYVAGYAAGVHDDCS